MRFVILNAETHKSVILVILICVFCACPIKIYVSKFWNLLFPLKYISEFLKKNLQTVDDLLPAKLH